VTDPERDSLRARHFVNEQSIVETAKKVNQ